MEDYGLLTGLAEGLNQGIKSYQDTVKTNQLLQDKIEERKRAKMRDQMTLTTNGLMEDAATGLISVDPNSYVTKQREEDRQLKQLQADASLAKSGLMRQAPTAGGLIQGVPTDDMSAIESASTQAPTYQAPSPGGLVKTPDQMQKDDLDRRYKEAQIGAADALRKQRNTNTGAGGAGLVGPDGQEIKVSPQQNRIDMRAHSEVVKALKNDPQLKARIVAENNINNALATIADPNIATTPQQIHEFQQAIRSNMGIKGTGGIGEREATYINSLGMNAATVQQFLTGDPVELSKDSKLMQHFKDMAAIEKKNVEHQAEKRIKTLTGGYGSIYKRRPDLKADLDDLTTSTQGQLGTELQGLKGPITEGGLLNAPSAEDQQAIQWANDNPNDPRSKKILKLHGM